MIRATVLRALVLTAAFAAGFLRRRHISIHLTSSCSDRPSQEAAFAGGLFLIFQIDARN